MKQPLNAMIVFADSDVTNRVFPAAGWSDTSGAEMFRESIEARNMPVSGATSITVGLQVCNTPDAPDTPVALSASRTTDGLTFPGALVDKSSTTGNRQLWRPVYLVKNTAASDTTLRFAWVAGMIETQKK